MKLNKDETVNVVNYTDNTPIDASLTTESSTALFTKSVAIIIAQVFLTLIF